VFTSFCQHFDIGEDLTGALDYLEPLQLGFGVVFQEIAEALLVAMDHSTELGLEGGFVEDVADADTAARHLGAVGWACHFISTVLCIPFSANHD
jgi:hypothetical protein